MLPILLGAIEAGFREADCEDAVEFANVFVLRQGWVGELQASAGSVDRGKSEAAIETELSFALSKQIGRQRVEDEARIAGAQGVDNTGFTLFVTDVVLPQWQAYGRGVGRIRDWFAQVGGVAQWIL